MSPDLQHELDETRRELERARGWLEDIQSSLSWRITSPLRAAKRVATRTGRDSGPDPAAKPPPIARVAPEPEAGSAPGEQHERVRQAMQDWHLVLGGDELYYEERYWEWIEATAADRGVGHSGRWLDLGCGPGRFLVRLAAAAREAGGDVVGADLLPEQLEIAAARAAEQGLTNVTLEAGDALDFVRRQPDAAFDGVLFVGVSLSLLDLDSVLAELHRIIRPGGLLLMDFRPLFYLLALAAAKRDWALAEAATSGTRGRLPGLGFQHWHTADSGTRLLEDAGFRDVTLAGVGAVSGIPGDPQALIVTPGSISRDEWPSLAAIESALGERVPDVGRYMRAAATRP